jgi:hypothetical protein
MSWYKIAQLLEIDRTDARTSRQEYRDIGHDLQKRDRLVNIEKPNYMWIYRHGIIEAEPETMDQPSHAWYPQWEGVDYTELYAGRYSASTKTVTIIRPLGSKQFLPVPSAIKRLLQQKFPEAEKLSIHA